MNALLLKIKMNSIPFNLTQKEAALINIIRNLGHGTVEKIGVSGGEPDVLTIVTQRIDLSKENEIRAVPKLKIASKK